VTARRWGTLGLLLLCLGATGCGRTADREQATEVADRFFAAVRSGDGATACAQLSADTRKALEKDEQKPCREAIGGVQIEPGALTEIELYLNNAKADLDNGDSAFLSLTAQGWRLSAVGCKPGDGPPADVPMDCELEA
jgi:hypothetical protein